MTILATLGWAVASLTAAAVSFYLYRRFVAHRYFKTLGISGPPPHWLLGNLIDLIQEGTRHLVIAGWTKKYGKIYGYFEGPRPTMVIADVNLVQQAFVKQFLPHFHGRKMFAFQPSPESTTEPVHMFFARGARWKRLRTIINPTFSAGKMRAMTPLMQKCNVDFMELVDKRAKSGEPFDLFDCYKLLTLDTISECAFGVELNSAKTEGKNNPILDTINETFKKSFNIPSYVKIAMFLPEMIRPLRAFVRMKSMLGTGFLGPMINLYNMMDSIIQDRKTNPGKRRPDLLQMMLELEDPDAVAANVKAAAAAGGEIDFTSMPFSLKGLTHEEIKAQAALFMIAGYETSSNALAFTTFLLAKNPDKQEKLYAEIMAHFPDDKHPVNYDTVHELEYLDQVINEGLRMYPIAGLVLNRMAMEETVLEGVHIPKGLSVQVDVWSIHYDPELWGPVDPEKFYPERFAPDYPTTPGRDPAAFLTFGFGPRICIGMRFALLEIKLALVSVMRKYRIDDTPRTGETLDLKVAQTMTPKNGVWVKLTRRN